MQTNPKEELNDAPQVMEPKSNVDRSAASSIPGTAASSPVSATRNW